eukprot:TRINITY_DN22926_c0_g1_i1.p2 TRINITY_DN22926_c0_g1~~TRINITY_DN22926_c0_g1_i1.p2  ORF type:complete len:197 (+),score=29.91 TRINITY_DN22926_c0_g1_i1:97-687(+)
MCIRDRSCVVYGMPRVAVEMDAVDYIEDLEDISEKIMSVLNNNNQGGKLMNMSQYMSVFIDESREHLQLLNDSLLVLEKDTDNIQIVEEIFRSAHTLKGMSATMGFTRTAELTHKMEDVLDQIRNSKIKVDSNMLDLLFECLDTLNLLIDEVIENDGEEITETDNLEKKLELLVSCLLYTSPSPRDLSTSRMPSSA